MFRMNLRSSSVSGLRSRLAENSPMSSCRSISSCRHIEFISLAIAVTHARACSWMSRSRLPTEMSMKSTSSSARIACASAMTFE